MAVTLDTTEALAARLCMGPVVQEGMAAHLMWGIAEVAWVLATAAVGAVALGDTVAREETAATIKAPKALRLALLAPAVLAAVVEDQEVPQELIAPHQRTSTTNFIRVVIQTWAVALA